MHAWFDSSRIGRVSAALQRSFFAVLRFGARAETPMQATSTFAGDGKLNAGASGASFCPTNFVVFFFIFHRVLSMEFSSH